MSGSEPEADDKASMMSEMGLNSISEMDAEECRYNGTKISPMIERIKGIPMMLDMMGSDLSGNIGRGRIMDAVKQGRHKVPIIIGDVPELIAPILVAGKIRNWNTSLLLL